MTKYWLLKTEPDVWGWHHQLEAGVTSWADVRNYQARSFIRSMEIGDLGLFYHTGNEKQVVGIVRIISKAYPDPTNPAFSAIDVETYKALVKPVTLTDIKANPNLQNNLLVRSPRLSVIPFTDEELAEVLKMGETNI